MSFGSADGYGVLERVVPSQLDLPEEIQLAFAEVKFPGDWCLRRSNEGQEPFLLERDFAGRDNWQSLDPGFLDNAPDGFASALSFFSDEAFRFYLPAYLIADLAQQLKRTDVVFHLTHGVTDETRNKRVNPQRYGERTWFDETAHRFSVFDTRQAAAIVRYLLVRRDMEDLVDFERDQIDEALRNYWRARST